MSESDPKLSSFRAGDFQRKKAGREAAAPGSPADAARHYPALEQLLESEEAALEANARLLSSSTNATSR